MEVATFSNPLRPDKANAIRNGDLKVCHASATTYFNLMFIGLTKTIYFDIYINETDYLISNESKEPFINKLGLRSKQAVKSRDTMIRKKVVNGKELVERIWTHSESSIHIPAITGTQLKKYTPQPENYNGMTAIFV